MVKNSFKNLLVPEKWSKYNSMGLKAVKDVHFVKIMVNNSYLLCPGSRFGGELS